MPAIPFVPNSALIADTIKYTHHYQYPPDCESLYGYLEPRKVFRGIDEMTWVGLLYYLDFLSGEFFTLADTLEAYRIVQASFNDKPTFNLDGPNGFRALIDIHKGRVPISIRSAPEGTQIPVGNIAMSVESTDPRFIWMATFVETLLMKAGWYTSMVATKVRSFKTVINQYLIKSGSPETLRGRLADFGSRSAAGMEAQALGGIGHLVNFDSTTNLFAVQLAEKLYKCPIPRRAVHGMEHSTIISWGKDGEEDAYDNMFDQNPTGNITIVSDSTNVHFVLRHLWGEKFKGRILTRDGVFLPRLDSGSPAAMVLEACQVLDEKFGTVKNHKGYKVLHPKICPFQGDGVNIDNLHSIYEALTEKGYSSDNVFLGSGGDIIQNVSRDMMSEAFKASHGMFSGTPRAFRKEPITDPGKWSKMGRQKLVEVNGHLHTEREGESDRLDLLREVFRNGDVLVRDEMPDIQKRSWT